MDRSDLHIWMNLPKMWASKRLGDVLYDIDQSELEVLIYEQLNQYFAELWLVDFSDSFQFVDLDEFCSELEFNDEW